MVDSDANLEGADLDSSDLESAKALEVKPAVVLSNADQNGSTLALQVVAKQGDKRMIRDMRKGAAKDPSMGDFLNMMKGKSLDAVLDPKSYVESLLSEMKKKNSKSFERS